MRTTSNLIMIVLLATILPCCNKQPSQTTESESVENESISVKEYFITHDGLRIGVREKFLEDNADSAPVLVLLPSATFSCAPNWDLQKSERSVMDFFAKKGWRVVAVDLPGYGDSDDPKEPNRFGAAKQRPFVSAAIEKIATEHQVEQVDLLGWSWGAQVAGHYAEENSHRVRSLVLYGYTWAKRHPENRFPPGFLNAPFRDLTREGALSDFIEGCGDTVVNEAYADACLAADKNVPLGSLNDFVHELPLVAPKKITMPCLVISGQYELEPDDPDHEDLKAAVTARKKDLDAFCGALPQELRHVVVVPKGGHAVHLENFTDWSDAVMKFLQANMD